MKKLFAVPFAGRSNAGVIKSYILGLSAIFLVSTTKAADTVKGGGSKAGHANTATPHANAFVLVTVNLTVTPQNPLAVYFTPVGGGQTLSFLCFDTNNSFSIPTGSYDVKFTIPTSTNPFHQINVGSSLIWMTPFPDLPVVSGGVISNLSVSAPLTVSVS